MVFATILNRKQKLGDILLTKQLIDDETLNKALEIRKASKNKRLGEIMIEMGALSREVIDRELRGSMNLEVVIDTQTEVLQLGRQIGLSSCITY